MTTTKHTPTPWTFYAVEGHCDTIIVSHAEEADEGNVICEAPLDLPVSLKHWPHNAAFIVRAVNAHEIYEQALVAISLDAFLEPQRAWEIANAALRKATGE